MEVLIWKAVIAGAAGAASLGIGVAPAAAASVTVSGGPSFTSVSTDMVLTSGSITIHCSTSTASGSVAPGSYVTPAQVGIITGTSFSGCTAFGVSATVIGDTSTPWQWWATGASSGGVTPGELRGIKATVQVPSLGCTIVVSGPLPDPWINSMQTLTFAGGALSTTGSGFCLGLSSTGSMSGHLAVAGSPSPISIL